jgi:hypothetical protein
MGRVPPNDSRAYVYVTGRQCRLVPLLSSTRAAIVVAIRLRAGGGGARAVSDVLSASPCAAAPGPCGTALHCRCG